MQQADVARTVSGPTAWVGSALKGVGPGLSGAWGPGSQQLAGWPHPTRPARLAEGLGLAMISRITGANTGQWVRLFNDLARNQKKNDKNAFIVS